MLETSQHTKAKWFQDHYNFCFLYLQVHIFAEEDTWLILLREEVKRVNHEQLTCRQIVSCFTHTVTYLLAGSNQVPSLKAN